MISLRRLQRQAGSVLGARWVEQDDGVTKGNNLVIRIYGKNDAATGGANARKSQHHLATVKIDYTG